LGSRPMRTRPGARGTPSGGEASGPARTRSGRPRAPRSRPRRVAGVRRNPLSSPTLPTPTRSRRALVCFPTCRARSDSHHSGLSPPLLAWPATGYSRGAGAKTGVEYRGAAKKDEKDALDRLASPRGRQGFLQRRARVSAARDGWGARRMMQKQARPVTCSCFGLARLVRRGRRLSGSRTPSSRRSVRLHRRQARRFPGPMTCRP
jgi:hypothetical protein